MAIKIKFFLNKYFTILDYFLFFQKLSNNTKFIKFLLILLKFFTRLNKNIKITWDQIKNNYMHKN